MDYMPRMRSSLPKIEDYPAYLNECWQKHLEPRQPDAPTVISLFAGCGGSSLGYSMAGYRELLAVEWDNNAVETFKLNFPDVPVFHGDIADCSVDWILKTTGLKPGELDILDGSPPCQGFSIVGKRILDDDRNQLFKEYVRILRGLKPKVFVMENVDGLVKGKMKLVFAEIMRELKASGYKVSARLMNTKWFGVPQSRERMIFISDSSHPMARYQTITVNEAWLNLSLNNDAPRLSPLYQAYWKNAKQGESVGNYLSSKKLNINKPSFSLTKAEGYGGAYHPTECRGINTAERKRLGSFPDEFIFTDWRTSKDTIGNSVPPVFMMHIAEHIRHQLTGQQPGETPELLES